MIAHLNGDYETVDYTGSRSVLLYDNTDDEEYPYHWHNALEIIMPLVNDYHVICGGREYVLEERDIMIIPSGELHCLKASEGRRLIFLCNHGMLMNPALTDLRAMLSEPIHISRAGGDSLLSTLGQYMTDIYTLYFNFEPMAETYIYIKLLTMLTRIWEQRAGAVKDCDSDKYADKFQMILKYIDNNYMYDISLDGLAEIAGYSKYHFSRIFKKYSSETFIDLVNRRRMRAAEMLLLEDNMSVTDIAMQSGFSSMTTFNRVFKKFKGYTPSEFKKLYKLPETRP